MKDHEWAALEVGDQVRYVGGDDESLHNDYQVAQIKSGTVYGVRLIQRRQLGTGGQAAQTETVEIRANSDDWKYMRLRPKLALSGGFLVKRADGTEEYEQCPTPTTRSKPKDATIAPRGQRREGLK